MADGKEHKLCGDCGITEEQATAFNKGRYVDRKTLYIVLLGWFVTIGWSMVQQHFEVKANTEFRRTMSPVIAGLKTEVSVTNRLLLRIETQLATINDHYIGKHFEEDH